MSDFDAMRARHVRTPPDSEWDTEHCREDDGRWPCDFIQADDARRAADGAIAEALDDALAAVERIAETGGADGLTWEDAIAACADAVASLA